MIITLYNFLSTKAERRRKSKHTFIDFVILIFLLSLLVVFIYSYGFLCSVIAKYIKFLNGITPTMLLYKYYCT